MNKRRPNLIGSATSAGRVVTGLFGLIFGGIGLTVIAFLWGSSWNEFGSPPLFFRVFGSLIAMAFVVFGGAAVFGAFTAGNVLSAMNDRQETSQEDDRQAASAPGYICPQCSAPLSGNAEVSPHGDVKCGYCQCWFNVHGK